MKINIKVRPHSRKEKVEKTSESELSILVKVPAREGRANEAAVKLLSAYFNIPKSRIAIVQGQNSRNKVAEIL